MEKVKDNCYSFWLYRIQFIHAIYKCSKWIIRCSRVCCIQHEKCTAHNKRTIFRLLLLMPRQRAPLKNCQTKKHRIIIYYLDFEYTLGVVSYLQCIDLSVRIVWTTQLVILCIRFGPDTKLWFSVWNGAKSIERQQEHFPKAHFAGWKFSLDSSLEPIMHA